MTFFSAGNKQDVSLRARTGTGLQTRHYKIAAENAGLKARRYGL
jgi:hypothetical protein